MPAPGVMQSEFVINGSFGELYTEDGLFLAPVQRIEANIRSNRRDIMRAGTRQMAYKLMTIQGDGTIGLLKVTSMFLQIVSEPMRSERQIQRILSLRVKLDDPEALGVEEYRLTKVKLWEVNLGFNVNDVIEEAIPFTFENLEPVSWITGDPMVSQQSSRYQALD